MATGRYDEGPMGDPDKNRPGSCGTSRMPKVSQMALDALVYANKLCFKYLELFKGMMKL